jgi:hypothetical protein
VRKGPLGQDPVGLVVMLAGASVGLACAICFKRGRDEGIEFATNSRIASINLSPLTVVTADGRPVLHAEVCQCPSCAPGSPLQPVTIHGWAAPTEPGDAPQ